MTTQPREAGSQGDVVERRDGDESDAETVPAEAEQLGKPVDPPGRRPVFADVVARTDNRRPIVPASLRSKDQRRTLYRWAVRLGAHTTAYHITRTPKYLAKVAWYAPVGMFVGLWRLGRWAIDWETMRRAIAEPAIDKYLQASHQRDRRARPRQIGVIAAALLLAIAVLLLLTVAPWWWRWVALAAVMPVLAWIGRPADKPITDRVSNGPRYRKLTAELVRRAIGSCGVPAINSALAKDPGALVFPQEIGRDGPGYLAIVDLPFGVEATDVIERRGRLASGLRLPIDQVWPEAARGHTGRLALWVGDEPASQMKQPPWPLLSTSAKVDVFRSFPFATDPRLNVIKSGLMYRNWLIGAMPGAGKTFALRLLLLAAALDPRVELRGYELKGSGDLDALEPVCTEYGSGMDDDTAEAALGMLRDLHRECQRRGPIVKKMARAGKAPENKVTPQLAGIQSLGLHPLVAFVDECQNLFAHKQYGEEAGELAEKVIKLGRALGIVLLLATQRPDSKSLPTGVSANAGVRFCLRVMGQLENDMILGTSMYKNGFRATQFGDEDLGWGWLVGQGKPVACRGFYVDGPGAKRVAARAVELRGGPVDVDTRERVPAYNLLEDVRAVWPAGEEALWSELIVPRLAELRPEVYGDWDVTTFGAAMRAAGVEVKSVHRKLDGKGVTRYGVRLDALEAVLKPRGIQ